MEFDRRVQIRVRQMDGGGPAFGTGYLLAPRLVLSAAHVLEGMPASGRDAITVSRPDAGGQEHPATVAWLRKDAVVDAALVEIPDTDPEFPWPVPESLGDLVSRPPQRFGHLIGTRPHPVTLVGFPRMQKDPDDGRRLDEQVTGRIPPGTGSLAERYEILGNDPIPGTDTGHTSAWAGVSGAAVLADDGPGGDFLLGVVRCDHRGTGGIRLSATRTAHLLRDTGFCDLITRHTGWEPVLEPVEPAGVLAPAAPGRDLVSPAALLRADAEAVTFHGREKELDDLHEWCTTGPATIDVRVLTGPGGQGKTRLARRLADRLAREGWATGHLRSDLTDHTTQRPDLSSLTTALPLLVVVDYAETRPRLLRELIATLQPFRHRVRVLLLARSDGAWLTDGPSASHAVRNLLAAARVLPLASLNPRQDGGSVRATGIRASGPAADREAAFRDAAGDLARLLPRVPSVPGHDWAALTAGLRPPGDLAHARYGNALTLQMAALAALLQHGPAPTDAAPGTPLEEILLQHENRFWEDTARAPAYKLGDLPTTTLGAAVATAILCGAAGEDEAVTVLRSLPGLPAEKTQRVAAWVQALYPPAPGRYWGALHPDRIAEYHASRAVSEGALTLPVLLRSAAPGQQAQLVTVLVRAAIAHYNAGRTRQSDELLRILDTNLDIGVLDHRALRTAIAALPHPARPAASLAARLTGALVDINRQGQADDTGRRSDLAASLSNLGVRLAEVRRRDDALTATNEAVDIYRRLATADPAAYEPGFAASLSNLGVRLAEVGRRNDALTATNEAVDIYRRLATADPAAYEPDFAASLCNLGTRLANEGRSEAALSVTRLAVSIYQQLADADPAVHAPGLAGALCNLGIDLAGMGRRDDALTSAEKAVTIRQRLAEADPAVHEPGLMAALSSLALRLLEKGLRPEALRIARQAKHIRQRLAAADAAACEPDLAESLTQPDVVLTELERRAKVLHAESKAAEIYRWLDNTVPSILRDLGKPMGPQAVAPDALGLAEDGDTAPRRPGEESLPPAPASD